MEFDMLRFGKPHLAVALSILLMIIGCAADDNQSDSADWVLLTHEDYGFSIEYPSKWDAEVYGDSGKRGARNTRVFINKPLPLFSDDPGVWIRIEQRDFVAPTLSDVIAWGDELLDRSSSQTGFQEPRGYQEILFSEEILNDISIARRRYTHFGMENSIAEDVYIPRENDMIIIYLFATDSIFDQIYDDFDHIVTSFRTLP